MVMQVLVAESVLEEKTTLVMEVLEAEVEAEKGEKTTLEIYTMMVIIIIMAGMMQEDTIGTIHTHNR